MTWLAPLMILLAANAAAETEKLTDVLGYSPELNVIFAQSYEVPDNGRCVSYVLDLNKQIKYSMPPLQGVADAIQAVGEDAEGASCQLREFTAQLELSLKTAKNASPDEKAKFEPYLEAEWGKPLKGIRDESVASLGAFLRLQRPQWRPELAVKLYELGVQEAEDKGWMDGFSALVIASEWKPGYVTQAGREKAVMINSQAEKMSGDKKSHAMAILAWEMAIRLDPIYVPALLNLAKQPEVGFDRAGILVARALKREPVRTTKSYREDSGFHALRCDPKAGIGRKRLPLELTKDAKCN